MTDHSRRKFNKVLGGAVTVVPLAALLSSRQVAAAAVDPESPVAKGLQFTLTSEVDGKICSGCLLYTAIDGEKGTCSIFGSDEVPAGGWCISYQPKA